MPSIADALTAVLGLLGARPASAEVVAGDPQASELIQRLVSGPRTLPSYVASYQAAQDRPEQVTVRSQRGPFRGETPDTRAITSDEPPWTIDIRYPRAANFPLPEDLKDWPRAQRGMAQGIPPWKVNPYLINMAPRLEQYTPEADLAHELGHFLVSVLGLQIPKGYDEETLVESQALYPMDPGLMRAGLAAQPSGQLSPYWKIVQRLMGGR